MTAVVPDASGTPRSGLHELAEFDAYADAQALVDRLSDRGFPVERVRIVGSGLQSVEQVTGRLTKGRAAAGGAASGAWFGLLVGLLLAVFSTGSFVGVVLTGLLVGAVWGAVFGFAAHAATRGRRDFASVQTVRARSYSVQVDAELADEAIRTGGLIS